MKKLSYGCLIPIFGLMSCGTSSDISKDNINISKEPKSINTDVSKISFGAKEHLEETLGIKAVNTNWEISNELQWLDISPLSGKSSTDALVKAKENLSVDEVRIGSINLHSTEQNYRYSKDITVNQNAADVFIIPSETSLSVNAQSQKKTLAISSNVTWEAQSSDSWVTVRSDNNSQLLLDINENRYSTESRSATIYLKRTGTNDVVNTIKIIQSVAGVTSSKERISFRVEGGIEKIDIETELSWKASVSDASWISVSPQNGEQGKKQIEIATLPNFSTKGREGFVYITIGMDKRLAIPIYQYPILISSETEKMNFKSRKESQTIKLYANTEWKIVSCPLWITIEPSSGIADPSIPLTISVQDNPNTTTRTGTIVYGREGLTGNKTIQVTQAAKLFSDLEDNVHFSNIVSSQSVKIETDGVWTASTDVLWLHVSPDSGDGNANILISADANPNKEARQGNVMVRVGETVKNISVNQEGRYINVSCEDVLKNSKPAKINMSLSSNTSWTASSDVDWLVLSAISGNGDAYIEISVSDNPSVNSRKGHIIIANQDGEKNYSFEQPGRTLTMNCESLNFYSNGGTSDAIVVTTDGEFEVSSSDSWITINQEHNTFTVVVDKNENESKREGTIEVKLVGLLNDEKYSLVIPVNQVPKYVKIDKPNFDDDENWNY